MPLVATTGPNMSCFSKSAITASIFFNVPNRASSRTFRCFSTAEVCEAGTTAMSEAPSSSHAAL